MPQLTVAAINGACAGAGLGWACVCDLRYAARSAKLNTAFLDVAVAGDMGLPWTLPRLVGASLARDLSFFPRRVTADEAAGSASSTPCSTTTSSPPRCALGSSASPPPRRSPGGA